MIKFELKIVDFQPKMPENDQFLTQNDQFSAQNDQKIKFLPSQFVDWVFFLLVFVALQLVILLHFVGNDQGR